MRLRKWQWRKKRNHELKSFFIYWMYILRKYSTRKRKIITNFKMNSEKLFVVSRLDFLTIVLKKYVNIFRNDVFSKIYIRYRILFWGATLWFTVQLINGKGKFYIFERIDNWNSHIKYFNSQSSSSILSNLSCKPCNLFKMISLFFQLLLSL